jgi:hypothetical protein
MLSAIVVAPSILEIARMASFRCCAVIRWRSRRTQSVANSGYSCKDRAVNLNNLNAYYKMLLIDVVNGLTSNKRLACVTTASRLRDLIFSSITESEESHSTTFRLSSQTFIAPLSSINQRRNIASAWP